MAIDQSVINFAVYEDSVEYLGMSKVTLPDVTFLTQSISGAGVGGNVEAVILGAGCDLAHSCPLFLVQYVDYSAENTICKV